jgi:hypothetical protein
VEDGGEACGDARGEVRGDTCGEEARRVGDGEDVKRFTIGTVVIEREEVAGESGEGTKARADAASVFSSRVVGAVGLGVR